MSRDDLLLGLFSCLVLFVSLTWQARSHQTPSEATGAQSRVVRHAALTRLLPALLCALLCSTGAILLLPWAATLPSVPSGWAPGGAFAALVFAGAIYTMGGRKTDE